jgi:DNA-binding IclR family transcriptional regulator
LSSAEWKTKAYALDVARSTFFRIRRKLTDEGYVQFDQESQTWSLITTFATTGQAVSGETDGTRETETGGEVGPAGGGQA